MPLYDVFPNIRFGLIEMNFPELKGFGSYYKGATPGESQLKKVAIQGNQQECIEVCRKLIRKARVNFEVKSTPKSEKKAEEFKDLGNMRYREGKFKEALVAYNKGIAHTPKGSFMLCLLFANRSAVYLEVRLYDECLQNLDLAKANGYPMEKLANLEKRRERCMELMRDPNKQAPKFDGSSTKLSSEPHERNPFVAKSVELRSNKKFGLHAVAGEKLQPGEVVMIHEPQTWVLQGDYIYSRCLGCLKIQHLNLSVPCDGCTRALFCSEDCKEAANQKFHRIDCLAMHKIGDWFNLFIYSSLAVRDALLALHLFPDLNGLAKVVRTIDEKPQSVLELDFNGPEKEENLWKVMYASRHENEILPVDYKVVKAFESALIYEILMMNSSLGKKLKSVQHQQLFMRLICHFLINNNLYFMMLEGLESGRLEDITSVPDIHVAVEGYASYPFFGFLRHSCMPSVADIDLGRDRERLLNFTQRPVDKGGHLQRTFCCCCVYYTNKKSTRQDCVLKELNKKCKCVACTRNYPQMLLTNWKNIRSGSVVPFGMRLESGKSKEQHEKDMEKNCETLSRLMNDDALTEEQINAQAKLYFAMAGLHWNGDVFAR